MYLFILIISLLAFSIWRLRRGPFVWNDRFYISRSVLIDASTADIAVRIVDLKTLGAWHVFVPDAAVFNGEQTCRWQGGSFSVAHVKPDEIYCLLRMSKPPHVLLSSHSKVVYGLKESNGATDVEIAVYGIYENTKFLTRLRRRFLSLDQLVGSELEADLVALKDAVEGEFHK